MKAAVLGVGLIGGSLALGLKERTSCRVSGYDRSQEALDWAVAAGVIDEGSQRLESVVEDANFIFLAVPVGTIPELLSRLEHQPLKPGCIISDVGSTKGELIAWSEAFRKRGVTYIGGHPMAGSHRSGVKAAHSLLFESAYYILTPSPETPLSEVQRLSGLLQEATKAKLVIMDPFHHDRLVGAISHLPHVIAAGLVNQVGRYNEENESFHRLAAGGFRDLTRIAASHPVMWRDILMSNRRELLTLMEDWLGEMEKIRDAIAEGDAEMIEAFFRRARFLRERLPERKKGMLLPSFECYVDVPDQPGMIGRVATLLGEEGINLSNIGVMENREDAGGVLRLVFHKEADLKRAIRFLSDAGYRVFSFD